jgi:RNA polymerase sigma-70 factor, ECF subfamily
MADQELLAERFEADRARLTAVAYRMLGSAGEADDAVQEAWLRLSRSDAESIDNLTAWLTTVVGRVCLDMLRSRRTRSETPLETSAPFTADDDPERDAMLADSVGLALLIVLDTLNPAERLSFVLHDMFAVPFEDIAPIVGRTPEATRQLASRARRRVQGEKLPETDVGRQREVVDAFLAASRAGEFEALLRLLDPEVLLRADAVATSVGGQAEIRGATDVASFFRGRARAAQPALIDGAPGLVVYAGGTLRFALVFTMDGDRVAGIEAIADPATLAELQVG